ncbi:ATP-dependent DNA helicase, partial [Tamlana crocina]|nr:ATP-dependent DNA helicase [Tamlana crocina]
SKFRQTKPVNGTPPPSHKPTDEELQKLRKLRPVSSPAASAAPGPAVKLDVGDEVEHLRFGKGKVLNIEGVGQDKKAEIHFENGGLKKLLLKFAKLKVLS